VHFRLLVLPGFRQFLWDERWKKAKSLVESVKFPAIGGRGIDEAGLDSDFCLQGMEITPTPPIARRFLSCKPTNSTDDWIFTRKSA
jgi:hypothetical protein